MRGKERFRAAEKLEFHACAFRWTKIHLDTAFRPYVSG